MSDYTPHVWHYLLPAFFMIGGAIAAPFSTLLMIGLYVLALVSGLFITFTGFWGAKECYWRGVADIAGKLPQLTKEQQKTLGVYCPELRVMFGGEDISPSVALDNSGVDFQFFLEFMANSTGGATWAERDVQGTVYESREARRDKWVKLTAWLYDNQYLAIAPRGQHTYIWQGQSYYNLRKTYVIPFARLVGETPSPVIQAPSKAANILQSDTERVIA
jgi:hypothetical protein